MAVNATTLTRVKAQLGDAGSANDTLLTSLIDSVSRAIEKYIGYEIESKSRTETYDVNLGDHLVFLRSRPVSSITSVKIAVEGVWDFTAYTALVANQQYRLIGNELYLYSGYTTGRDVLQVVYVAGIAATDTAVPTNIALAADIQIAEEWRRRNNPAVVTVPGPKGSKTLDTPHRLLPRVAELLSAHRKRVFA